MCVRMHMEAEGQHQVYSLSISILFFKAGSFHGTRSSQTGRLVSAGTLPASSLPSAGVTDAHYPTQHLHVS